MNKKRLALRKPLFIGSVDKLTSSLTKQKAMVVVWEEKVVGG